MRFWFGPRFEVLMHRFSGFSSFSIPIQCIHFSPTVGLDVSVLLHSADKHRKDKKKKDKKEKRDNQGNAATAKRVTVLHILSI